MVPLPVVNLGDDHPFCEGSVVTLDAGAGFTSYLWNTGENTATINTSEAGEYWVEVHDLYSCSTRDTIVLTLEPLPVAPEIISGPVTVDNFLSPSSEFSSSESMNANSYEWKLEPAGAGIISGTGITAQVSWSAGFTGTAYVSAAGTNDCGTSNYSQALAVSVYSSQSIGEKDAISGIKLYPNPNDGAFTLMMVSGKEQEIRFQIINSGGNQVLDIKENVRAGQCQKNFSLETLPAGTYYLVILDSGGSILNKLQVLLQ